MHASAACRLARKESRAGSMNAKFDSLISLTYSPFTPFVPHPHSRHRRSTRTHVLLSLSPHTIRRRHAAASSCTSCAPHGRTTGPTSPGTALLCYSDVFCVCFVRPSAQGRLLLRVLRAFRLLRCVKLFYQLAWLPYMGTQLLTRAAESYLIYTAPVLDSTDMVRMVS